MKRYALYADYDERCIAMRIEGRCDCGDERGNEAVNVMRWRRLFLVFHFAKVFGVCEFEEILTVLVLYHRLR